MNYWHVAICFIFASLQHCTSRRYIENIDLYFTSSKCYQDVKRVSESKVYRLAWYGRIKPQICSFSFNDQKERHYEICFQSLYFEIPRHLRGVELKIRNNTWSSWVFNSLDSRIDKVCVKWGYHLNISIAVPRGYIGNIGLSSKIYIQLQVTAKLIEDDGNVAGKIIGGFVSVIFLGCLVGTCAKGSSSNRDFLEDQCGRLCGSIADGLACKCLRDSDGPSCDCNVICRPCDICCIAMAECCTTVLVRQPGRRNASNNMQTQISNNVANLQGTSYTTVSTSEEPPPTYESIRDQSSGNIPDAPPPCYEDVVSQQNLIQSSA